MFILIIFDCRQSNAKHNVNVGQKIKYLKAGLILTGILLIFIALPGTIISIYFLVIMIHTTTTTSKNKVHLTKPN